MNDTNDLADLFAQVTRDVEKARDRHCCGCQCEADDVSAVAVVAIIRGKPEVWTFRGVETPAIVEALDAAHAALAR